MTSLAIDNVSHTFTPIQDFRADFGLPDDFAIVTFEPKEMAGLGSLEGSRDALAKVRQRVVTAVPETVTVQTIMNQVAPLAKLFRQELEDANRQIKLRPVEIDFAVAGFEGLIESAAYRLIQLHYAHRQDNGRVAQEFDFGVICQEWLNASGRLSATVHHYTHQGRLFDCRVIYYPYGRFGLEVQVDEQLFYLMDISLACPAASYMRKLCDQVAGALCRALVCSDTL